VPWRGSWRILWVLAAPGEYPRPPREPTDEPEPRPRPAATGVPEPASLTLLGIGALGLLGYGWRKRKQAA